MPATHGSGHGARMLWPDSQKTKSSTIVLYYNVMLNINIHIYGVKVK